MRKKFIIVLTSWVLVGCCLCFVSCCKNCDNSKLITIDIESEVNKWQTVFLSDFSNDIKYIRLESNNAIGYISDLDFTKDYIIINNQKEECLLFSLEGDLISIIGQKGRGPEEYEDLSNVRISGSGEIFVQSFYDLIIYDTSGIYIDRVNNFFLQEGYYISKWLPIGESLVLGKVDIQTGREEYKALLINRNGNIVKEFVNYVRFERERPVAGYWEQQASIFYVNDKYYFKEMYNDTLFCFEETDKLLVPEYNFKIGKYSETLSVRSSLLVDKYRNYIYLDDLFQLSCYFFLDFNFGDRFPAQRITPIKITVGSISFLKTKNTSHVLGIYDLTKNKLIFCEPTTSDNPLFSSGIYNDIDGGPRFFPNTMANDSTMVMWVEVKDLKYHVASDDFKNAVVKYPEKKQKLLELADSLDELDNPVLILVTLNECNGLKSLDRD
jgi:hypothetical protein